MSARGLPQQDVQIEQFLGNLLRAGVVLAASVVLTGGVLYLARHGGERWNSRDFDPPDLRHFEGEPADLRSPVGVITDAIKLTSRGLIQLGLLLLIATPVARVFFSAVAFAWERDYLYVMLTLIVLTVLLGSLFIGATGR